jgi:hypothetical protein
MYLGGFEERDCRIQLGASASVYALDSRYRRIRLSTSSRVSNTTILSSNDTIVIDLGEPALPSKIQVDVERQLAYFGPILVAAP